MPKLIKNGVVCSDDSTATLLSLQELNSGASAHDTPLAVMLEPDQPPSAIEVPLDKLALIAINFPVFIDGRGFSYARELRDLGYEGEIRAVGHFIRDQLHYLGRCGFNAFELPDNADIEGCLASLTDFSNAYQADVLQKEPLFRRR